MTIEEMAYIVEAEAGVLDYNGKLAVANCIKDNNYSSKAFTIPAKYYSDESIQAVKDSEAGKRRFPEFKILQFRSFKKYSDGHGNPDFRKVYSGICPMPKEYLYLGADGVEPWGNMYWGTKIAIPDYKLKLTVIHNDPNDLVNLRSTPEIKDDNIVGTVCYGGSYTIVERSNNGKFWKLLSGVYISADTKLTRVYEGDIVDYYVRVNIGDLNIRKGSGTNYAHYNEPIAPGVYNVVEEKLGTGASKWLLLKSYLDYRNGWISADFCERI